MVDYLTNSQDMLNNNNVLEFPKALSKCLVFVLPTYIIKTRFGTVSVYQFMDEFTYLCSPWTTSINTERLMFCQWLHMTPNYQCHALHALQPRTIQQFKAFGGLLHSSTHLYISRVWRGLDNETDNVLFNTCMETEKHHKRIPVEWFAVRGQIHPSNGITDMTTVAWSIPISVVLPKSGSSAEPNPS